MLELIQALPDPWVFLIEAAIVVTLGVLLWRNALQPLWLAVRAFVEHRERQEVLAEIADHFKPNGGASLWDRIIGIERTLDKLTEGQEKIANEFETFIMDRKPGGRRRNDPKDGHDPERQ